MTSSRSSRCSCMQFDGEAWHLFGDVITGEVGHETTH